MGKEAGGLARPGKPSWAGAKGCAFEEGEMIARAPQETVRACGAAWRRQLSGVQTPGAYLCTVIRLTPGSLEACENKQSLTSRPHFLQAQSCDQPSPAEAAGKLGLPPRQGRAWGPVPWPDPSILPSSLDKTQETLCCIQTGLLEVPKQLLPSQFRFYKQPSN